MSDKIIDSLVVLFESHLRKYTDVTLKTWCSRLSEYNEDEVLRAIKRSSREEFPTCDKIIDYVLGMDGVDLDAENVWMSIVSNYGNAPNDDAGRYAHRAVGGHDAIGYCDDYEGLSHLKRQFKEIYASKRRQMAEGARTAIEAKQSSGTKLDFSGMFKRLPE